MARLLTPVTRVDRRPTDSQSVESRYIRSFLLLRTFVGLLGVLLPVLLVAIDKLAFEGDPWPRGSLSAYYYSGMREVLVATLSATGVFFVAYKVAERNLDNFLSWVSGAASMLIALFPTGRPSGVALTPLQDLLGESVVKGIHYGAAVTCLVALTLMSFFFGLREGRRTRRKGMKRSPLFWRRYHWTCAAAMGLALVWIAVTWIAGGPRYSVLIGEWACAWAFGASWLMKGLELDMLRGKPAEPAAPVTPKPSTGANHDAVHAAPGG